MSIYIPQVFKDEGKSLRVLTSNLIRVPGKELQLSVIFSIDHEKQVIITHLYQLNPFLIALSRDKTFRFTFKYSDCLSLSDKVALLYFNLSHNGSIGRVQCFLRWYMVLPVWETRGWIKLSRNRQENVWLLKQNCHWNQKTPRSAEQSTSFSGQTLEKIPYQRAETDTEILTHTEKRLHQSWPAATPSH